ncbi:M48 family metalloprotease [Paenibacillus anseongense]|uniref:M48 family metalloprotease n=1 Tax=Paenibacillus TaxID=44249 RepID=UPI002DBD0B6E|nr:M48 family metalloprotease [Paenibacillus anseongense]MEC0268864.1 M48 family metalloprotease [Paenibacillus anseongense]
MSSNIENLETTICPNCMEKTPVLKGFMTWCDKCEWNVKADDKKGKPRNVFERTYLQVGEKMGSDLLQTLIIKGSLHTTFSWMRLFTYLAASVVHLFSLFLFVSGILLVVFNVQNIIILIFGCILLVFAWATRPRFHKLNEKTLAREAFPALYRAMDDIAKAMGSDRVEGVVINEKFNASYREIGLGRKKIITLGLPLIQILDEKELTALIAHELAHGINGDQNRSYWVGAAFFTLTYWYSVIRPDRLWDPGYRLLAFFMFFANLVLLAVSQFIYFLLYVLCHLFWQDSQRAEYLADQLAAQTASPKATVSLLNKLHLDAMFEFTILKVINSKRIGHFFEDFQEQIRILPQREMERLKRASVKAGARLDASHPPTANRVSFICNLEQEEPLYRMDKETFEQLNAELDQLKSSMEQKLIDYYKRYVLLQ